MPGGEEGPCEPVNLPCAFACEGWRALHCERAQACLAAVPCLQVAPRLGPGDPPTAGGAQRGGALRCGARRVPKQAKVACFADEGEGGASLDKDLLSRAARVPRNFGPPPQASPCCRAGDGGRVLADGTACVRYSCCITRFNKRYVRPRAGWYCAVQSHS